jgi:transposase-like protein
VLSTLALLAVWVRLLWHSGSAADPRLPGARVDSSAEARASIEPRASL